MTRFFRQSCLGSVAACALILGTQAARAESPATAETQATADAAKPVEWGAFGVQTQWIDSAVKPGDDFDEYVNGGWKKATVLADDKTRIGSFDELNDLSQERLRGILDGLVAAKPKPGTDEARVAAAYSAFMDTKAIDAAGMTPLTPYLKRIYAAATPADLIALFATPGFASPIGAYVGADEKQSDIYALNMGMSGLSLPDRDYYLKNDQRFQDIRAKFVDYMTLVFGKLGYADAAGAAKSVLALETQLAQTDWDRTVARNSDLTYNKVEAKDFATLADPALFDAFLNGMGANKPSYVLVLDLPPTAEELKAAKIDPAQAKGLIGGGLPAAFRLVQSQPVATWQAWLAMRFVRDHASVLPSDIDAATFDFFNKTLTGQPVQRPRWKRGIAAVEGQAGELLGKIYAAKYYPPAQKAAMQDLVSNLRKAMASNLQTLSWMGPATREQAEAKLEAFTPKIGAPDKFKTYEGLAFSATDPVGNDIAASRWSTSYDMNRIGKPVDRSEWFMLPETINAYYNPTYNEIVFPAAILQPPFFNLTADPAVNYGGIGAVIGHEMGHGFDDEGAKADGQGNLRDWWTAADKANFEKLQEKLAAQYDKFCPFDDGKTCVNGHLTMGENIGDLGGLSLAYRAYKLSLGGKEAPVIDGYTGDQRFFMSWAQVWRSKVREELARQYLIMDPHSPPHYRINGIVRNFDEWYKAFDIKPGDALYLPPEQRVRIW
ncbi:M13 family metallopeptidase [Novosphingobium colocasiae]|uniref:Peptidase M13 n=1 Tax=Novosphingobium colocasiae TaxID=1256513 RepID=A0A918UE12_9SPHN|nr:M13 family metallopeptidase [Novosphingobium colocasiae]GGY94566.1 peptidase M13 [Novosphingobium colocasiae]